MDKKILDYREKHPRCEYCEYYKGTNVDYPFYIGTIHTCKLKDRFIKFPNMLTFCRYYTVKEVKNEINN